MHHIKNAFLFSYRPPLRFLRVYILIGTPFRNIWGLYIVFSNESPSYSPYWNEELIGWRNQKIRTVIFMNVKVNHFITPLNPAPVSKNTCFLFSLRFIQKRFFFYTFQDRKTYVSFPFGIRSIKLSSKGQDFPSLVGKSVDDFSLRFHSFFEA